MKTLEEFHELYEENDATFLDMEMQHFVGEISDKEYREARLRHRLRVRHLNVLMQNREV